MMGLLLVILHHNGSQYSKVRTSSDQKKDGKQEEG